MIELRLLPIVLLFLLSSAHAGASGDPIFASEFEAFSVPPLPGPCTAPEKLFADLAVNIAPVAHVTVSSAYPDTSRARHGGCAVIDGVVGATSGDEWWSDNEVNPWIQLDWDTLHTITAIDLYDRADLWPNVNEGILSFSDGTALSVTDIPADGSLRIVTFAPKRVKWVRFESTGGTGSYNGLSEIAVAEKIPVTRPYAHSEQVNMVFWPGTRLTDSTPFSNGATHLDDKFDPWWDYSDGAWIQLDLGVGNIQQITGMRLRFGTSTWIASAFKIWVGNDPTNVSNTLVADVGGNTREIVRQEFGPTPGRFVRVQVFNPVANQIRVSGLSVYSDDPKPITHTYPISEPESGGARIEPLRGWGWYTGLHDPSNLISGSPVNYSPQDNRDDGNTWLDLAYEGAAFRIELDDSYVVDRMRLGSTRSELMPGAVKVELSVDDINYHVVFDGPLPPIEAQNLTWSTAGGRGDAKYIRVTLPASTAPNNVKYLSRVELYGLPVASPTVVPGETPSTSRSIGTIDSPGEGYLSAAVYSADGNLVRTLMRREPVAAGASRMLYWDGKDDFGVELAHGAYGWKAVVSTAASRDDGSIGNTGNPTFGLSNAPFLAGAVTFDPTGSLYVASSWDEPAQELRRFGPDGAPVWAVAAKFSHAVASDATYVYVAQWREQNGQEANVIRRYRASDGAEVAFKTSSDGAISINSYAVDPKPPTRRRATPEEDRWFVGVNGVAVGGDHLWISNYRQNRVECYDKATGAAIRSFPVIKPLGIAVDANGFVWVANSGSRVTKYSAGNPGWGTEVSSIASLADPYAIALAVGSERLFVTEQGTGRILEYDRGRASLAATHGRAAAPGPLRDDDFRLGSRAGVAADGRGRYVVADTGNHRVQWFDEADVVWKSLSSEFISAPFVDETGAVPNVVLSGPRQFTVDATTGAWRYTHNWTPSDGAFVNEVSMRRRLLVGVADGAPIYRDYLFYNADGWHGGVVAYLLEPKDAGMRRAAAIGIGWTGPDDNTLPGNGCFHWVDSSVDGNVDLAEVVFPANCVGGSYQVWVDEDGSLWMAGSSPAQGSIVIPLRGFDASLNPIYDFADLHTVYPVDNTSVNYRPQVIRSIPGSTDFLTLGNTSASDAVHGVDGFGLGSVATIHRADGSPKIRVNLMQATKAFTISADGEYWYTGNSRGDQHWADMYDRDGLLIATMRPGAPSNWSAGWMDHALSMSARKDGNSHYVYAEDVYWGRIIRYVTVVDPDDLQRSGGTFSW